MTKQQRDKNGLNKTPKPTLGIMFKTAYGKIKVKPVDGSYLKGAMQIADERMRQEIINFLREPMTT